MKYRHRKRILIVPTLRTFRSWLKRIRFKRHDNLSLYNFLKIFIHNINEDEIMDRANGVAYNFILAIFPTVIFLFTLIPYVSKLFPEINTQSIMAFLNDILPDSMYNVISSTVLDIVDNQRGGLLTFGFVLALFLATNGMNALMRAFNSCYKTVENRNFFRMRLTALGLTIMMAISLFLSILLLVVGQIVINYLTENIESVSHLNIDDYTIYLIQTLRFVVVFIVFFLAISCIYYFGPAIHYNWSFFSWGSLIATLSGIALSYGFSFYVTHFSSYNKVYGSIGVLIALMAWVQLLTIVLLFGYEINASLHYGVKVGAIHKHQRDLRKVKSSR